MRRWITIILGFIGIFIILMLGTNIFSFYMLLPLLGATALSVAIIIMKSVLKFDKPITYSFYMYCIVASTIIIVTIYFNLILSTKYELFLLMCMGFVGGIAQIVANNE